MRKEKIFIAVIFLLFVFLSITSYLAFDDINDTFIEKDSRIKNLAEENLNLLQKIIDTKEAVLRIQQDSLQTERNLKEEYNKDIIRKAITFAEVQDFVRSDLTDLKVYSEEYKCVEFTDDFIRNAYFNGIFTCRLYLEYGKEDAHDLVAVKTIDKGVVYIEPQTDEIVYNISLGDNYCELVNWNCTRIITRITSCFN